MEEGRFIKLILAVAVVLTPLALVAWIAPTSTSMLSSAPSSTSLSYYTPITPTRVCDTRPDNPSHLTGPYAQCNNRTLNGPTTLTVQITGLASVPVSSTAVVLNVTEIGDRTPGYLTVYPSGGTRPLVSNLNWTQPETLAGNVTVGLSSSGAINIYVSGGTANVIVDIEGYFGQNGVGFYPSTPIRICDTRPGNPSNLSGQQAQCNGRPLTPSVGYPIQVTGIAGIPLTATAVVVNITKIVSAAPSSYLDVYPHDGTVPIASVINWIPGRTVANQAVVKLSANGQIELYDPVSVNVIVDVEGWFANGGAGFVPVTPTRITDTRWVSGLPGEGQILSGGHPYRVTVANAMADQVPSSAVAAAVNVTAADETGSGYLTAYSSATQPTSSMLNWDAPGAVANASYSALSNGGFNLSASASTDVIVDISGYFTDTATEPLLALSVPTIQDSGYNFSTIGIVVQTDPLTATAPTWSAPVSSVSYQWFFCTPTCAVIPGATNKTYTILQAVPNQASIYVQVTASSDGTTASVDSAPVPVEHEWASYSTRMFMFNYPTMTNQTPAMNTQWNNLYQQVIDWPSQNLPMASAYFDPGCEALGTPESVAESPSCTQTMLSTWNTDRATQGDPPLLLPSNWFSLSQSEQLWIAMNLERSERGISIDPVLTNTLQCETYSAGQNEDPICGDQMGSESEGSGSLENLVGYLFDDGCGPRAPYMPYNADCPNGPWGHRGSILASIGGVSSNSPISEFNGMVVYISVGFVSSSKAGSNIPDQVLSGFGFNLFPISGYLNEGPSNPLMWPSGCNGMSASGACLPFPSSAGITSYQGEPVAITPTPLVNMTWAQELSYIPPCERYGDSCTTSFANPWNQAIINAAASSGSWPGHRP